MLTRTSYMDLVMRTAGLAVCLIVGAGCFSIRASEGGGITAFSRDRVLVPGDVAAAPGYQVEVIATGLTFPTGIAFAADGQPYVVESGYSYGELFTVPRLLRLEPDGGTAVVASGTRGPWNGLTQLGGDFYVAEGGQLEGGRILRITPQGDTAVVVSGLPSLGDHHTNGPVAGPDGWLYFGQGTATNSGVVGLDNADYGWLRRNPRFHDTPCQDVRLRGRNFATKGLPVDSAAGGNGTATREVVTGAFVPYGTPTVDGQVVTGAVPCNGAVLRVRPEGGATELVAWGFRNPYGLAFGGNGQLYVTDNAYDERGSRPIFGAGDLLWAVQPGTWYGWPDFHGLHPLTDTRWYGSRDGPAPEFLLAEHPNAPPAPAAILGVHSSSNGFDIAPPSGFGFAGQAFIAQFGDLSPSVGKVLGPVGFKVVRVDPRTGVVHDFLVNRGTMNGPASRLESGGLERPIAARFSPDGSALYVVDFGVMTVGLRGPEPREGTGVVWRVTRTAP